MSENEIEPSTQILGFPITVTARMRHGLLWKLRKQFGSTAAFARYLGIGEQEMGQWMNLERAPCLARMKSGRKRRRIELRLAKLGVVFEDLFPDELRRSGAFCHVQ